MAITDSMHRTSRDNDLNVDTRLVGECSPCPPTNGDPGNKVDDGQKPARQAAISIPNDAEGHQRAKEVEQHADHHAQVAVVALCNCRLQWCRYLQHISSGGAVMRLLHAIPTVYPGNCTQ